MSDFPSENLRSSRQERTTLVVGALLFPLFSPLSNAVALVRTIRNSTVLFQGQWDRFLNFRPLYAITMLFYWTQAIQLKRHGRHGQSPTLGNGAFPLTRWWHLTLPSSYGFHAYGIAGVIGAITFWWLSHLLWIQAGAVLLVAVMVLLLLSTTFFAQAFVTQNYNAFGWMFLPAALWGSLSGNWAVAGLAWFAASFASVTMIFVGCIVCVALAVETASLLPVILISPAALKVLGQIAAVQAGSNDKSIVSVLKAVGITNRGVRYQQARVRWVSLGFVYWCALLSIFTASAWWFQVPGRFVLAALLLLFVVNQKIARFADAQSFQIAWTSVASAVILASGNPYLLAPFWLLINPLPFMVDATTLQRRPLRLPVLAPFDIKRILEHLEAFLEPVAPGKRVLFLFPDPGTEHDRVFAGYRTIMEAAFHAGTRREVHILPDWYFVYEYNYPGAPDCWASDAEMAASQAQDWRADFVVAIETGGDANFATQLVAQGFEPLSSPLDWAALIDPSAEPPWAGLAPRWRLLRAPATLNQKVPGMKRSGDE